MKAKENVENVQDVERLAEKLQKCPCLYEKGNKGYRERERAEGKCLDSSWAVFNNAFMNNKEPSHTLKGHTLFFITFAEKFVIQIT